MLELVLYVLMAAPSAAEEPIMNYAIPLAIYEEVEKCHGTKLWLDEHSEGLPRHLFCMPIVVVPGEEM